MLRIPTGATCSNGFRRKSTETRRNIINAVFDLEFGFLQIDFETNRFEGLFEHRELLLDVLQFSNQSDVIHVCHYEQSCWPGRVTYLW